MMGPLLSQLHAQLQHDSNRAKAGGVFTLTAAFAALGLVSCYSCRSGITGSTDDSDLRLRRVRLFVLTRKLKLETELLRQTGKAKRSRVGNADLRYA